MGTDREGKAWAQPWAHLVKEDARNVVVQGGLEGEVNSE